MFSLWDLWTDNKIISIWAFQYCYAIEDREDVRNYITSELMAYYYCRDVHRDFEVEGKINDPTIKRYLDLY